MATFSPYSVNKQTGIYYSIIWQVLRQNYMAVYCKLSVMPLKSLRVELT